jgi:hypothetical protein
VKASARRRAREVTLEDYWIRADAGPRRAQLTACIAQTSLSSSRSSS